MAGYFQGSAQRKLDEQLKNFKWDDKNNSLHISGDPKYQNVNDLKIDYNSGPGWKHDTKLPTYGDYTGLGGGKGKAPGTSQWSQLDTAGKVAAGAGAAASILSTIDMLTGGQDTILAGSGHTYSSGYNPQMYIGRTV